MKVHLSINNTLEEGARANHSLLAPKAIVYVSQEEDYKARRSLNSRVKVAQQHVIIEKGNLIN